MSAIFSHSQGDCVRGQHGICGVTWRGLGVVGVVWCAVSYYAVYGDFWGDCHIYAGQMANCAKARGLCRHWSIYAYSFRFLQVPLLSQKDNIITMSPMVSHHVCVCQ